MGVQGWLRELARPSVPEPIAPARFRILATMMLVMSPLLVAANLLSRPWLVNHGVALGLDLTAFDHQLRANLPAHGLLCITAALMLRAKSERGLRILTMVLLALASYTAHCGLWLVGSVTSWNYLWCVLMIFGTRLMFDARLGNYVLWVVLIEFGTLVTLELTGVLPSHPLAPHSQLLDYSSRATQLQSAVWLVLVFLFAWTLSALVANRIRGSEHALRDINATLEARVQKQVSQLERAARLRRYLAPQVVEQILASDVDPGSVRERRAITVMFADLKGFTTMVEQLDPEQLSTVLMRYFDEVARIAFSHGGTIDKFIGDAVMVFFGAPEATGERDQALRCVRMCLEIQRRLTEISGEWASLGARTPLVARIGIASGVATVGAFGAGHRTEFTAVGAPVNRAARLEPQAPPGSVLLDDATRALIDDLLEQELFGELTLKGFAEPVRAFRAIALRSDGGPASAPRRLDSTRFFR